jgi:hypothetical protein
MGSPTVCIKLPSRHRPTGVCTISSDANGARQDWLACPYRTLDEHFTLIKEAIHLLFSIPAGTDVLVLSGEKIGTPNGRAAALTALAAGVRVFLFLSDKLGGEVDIPETAATPGSKVDVSIIEVTAIRSEGSLSDFGKHVFFEIQSADFHGSPLHAVGALEALAAKHPLSKDFYDALEAYPEIAGTAVEGPNKSNVFKRTFYQAVLKIRLAENSDCGGFVLVIPTAVWESWLKHFGNPVLRDPINGCTALAKTDEEHEWLIASSKAWIFVFDLNRSDVTSPTPLLIRHRIAISTESLLHYAFDEVATKAQELKVIDRYRAALKHRIEEKLWPPEPRAGRRPRKKR